MNALLLTFSLASCLYFCLTSTRVVLSLFALDLGAKPLDVGGLMALYYLFPLLLSWPVGKFADRVGARLPLTAAAASGVLGMLLPYLVPNLAMLYAASALCGLSFALSNVVLQTLVGVLSPSEARTQGFSNLSVIGSVANFTGPMVAGGMIDYGGGPPLASLALVLPYLAAMLLLAHCGAALPRGSVNPAPARNLLETLTDRGILRILSTSAMVQLGLDLYHFYMPIYGHSRGLSATSIGLVLSAFSLAAFVVRLALPMLLARLSEPRLLVATFLVAGAGFVLIPFNDDAYALAAVGFLFGLGIGGGAPLSMMLTFSYSMQGRSGEVMGLRLTATNLLRVITPVVFGTIGSLFGAMPVFLLSALAMGGGALLCRGLRGGRGQ